MDRKTKTEQWIQQQKLPTGRVQKLGEGAFGEVFLVQSEPPYVLKWQKKRNMAQGEALGLLQMAKCEATNVPKVLGVYEGKAGEEDAIRMTYLSGLPMTELHFCKKTRKNVAKSIAQAVAKFLLPSGDFGEVGGKGYATWQEFYCKKAEILLKKAQELRNQNKLSAFTFLAMTAAFAHFEDIFGGITVRRAFVHGDLNPQNIMLEKSGTLAGFLDPIGSLFGDNEYELFQLDTNGGKRYGILKEYAKIVPLSEQYPLKRDFYRLFAEVGYYFDADLKEGKTIKKWAKSLQKSLKNFLHIRLK